AGSRPAIEGEVLAPAVEAAAALPDPADDFADPAVTAREQAFDDRGPAVVVADADRAAVVLVRHDRALERTEPAVDGLVVQLGRPLERRMRLGHERAYRDGAADVLATGGLASGLDHPARHLRDLDVVVGLGRQAAHEVELHLPPAVAIRRRDGADQVVFADHLVDDPAHPFAAA